MTGQPDETRSDEGMARLIESAGEALYEAYVAQPGGIGWDEMARVVLVVADVPALLADRSRLERENERLRDQVTDSLLLLCRVPRRTTGAAMCECGGWLIECVCGDRCCDDCGCRAELDEADDDA